MKKTILLILERPIMKWMNLPGRIGKSHSQTRKKLGVSTFSKSRIPAEEINSVFCASEATCVWSVPLADTI